MPTVKGQSDDPVQAGVVGTAMNFEGPVAQAIGVLGEGGAGFPLRLPPGFNDVGRIAIGVKGTSESQSGSGVLGRNSAGGPGVQGESTSGPGIRGFSETSFGVEGSSTSGPGIGGFGQTNDGVLGTSQTGIGVHGKGGRLAGFFEGDVEITGEIHLPNADCAEDFDIAPAELAEPGTVMVLGNIDGTLHMSHRPYDKRVAGVVSGAGDYKPGIVLDRRSAQYNRRPIALLGKVYCKVDASYGSIEVGDLLTTSASTGYAMRAADPSQAFGAVIGKALRPLKEGQALIPILITLQ